MSPFSELARSRRSIRKFQDRSIPMADVEDLIRTATYAPSGCDSQCWRFVAILDRALLQRIRDAAVSKVEGLLSAKFDELPESYRASKQKMVGFFANAPVVIAVFMTPLTYYDPVLISAMEAQGHDYSSIMELFARPDLLSIGAAIQNLLLAAHEKGYGACWMNEPVAAAEEIAQLLDMPRDCKLISLIPLGYPAYSPREKQVKGLSEVFKSL